MRLALGLFATLLFAAIPTRGYADEALGAREIGAAFSGIERRCATDLPAAHSAALAAINAAAVQRHMTPAETPATRQGVLDAYALALRGATDSDADALARIVINSVVNALDANAEDGYIEQRACNCTAGIGLELRASSPTHTVVEPLPNTPAERAGLLPNDVLIAVDGASTEGMTLTLVVRLLRGEPGSTVALSIRRAGTSGPLTFNITRAVIRVRAVTSSVEDDIAYIKVRSLNETSAEYVHDAIREFRRQVRHPRGYVLDLRNNSGGLLDQAIEIADLFLDGGAVTTVRSSRACPAEEPQMYHARRGDETRGAPVIVLANANTASGAEIIAVALQERGRARIVGQTTFGLGSVSTVVPLSERAAMRLITGELASPNGQSLAGGLTPDVETEVDAENETAMMVRIRELLPPLQN